MKNLFLFLIFFSIYQIDLHANEQKNILIIHSYSQEYAWTKKQHDGFVNYINENIKTTPLEISTEYLDTKRVKLTKEYQDAFVKYLNVKYAGYTPDIIYVSDDNALTFMLENQDTLHFNAPLIFSGINNIELKEKLEAKKFTGIYEIKEIAQNIELIRNFSPQTREIYFLGDDSETYDSIKNNIKTQISKYPNIKFKFISFQKLSKVKKELEKLPNRSFVLLTTIGALKDEDIKNSTLHNSIRELSELKNIILLSMEDAYIEHNVIGGYVTDGVKQGTLAAQKAYKILKKIPFDDVNNKTADANTYIFNKKALFDSKLFLSEYISRDAIIINEENTFYIKYQKQILNVFFIFLVVSLISLTLIYFISREKKYKLQNSINKLKKYKHDALKKRKIISNIQNILNSIYWEYDTQNETVYILNYTDTKIESENKSSLSYDDFFNTLIHPSDFYELQHAIIKAKNLNNISITCKHRLILKDGSFIKVTNNILHVKSNNSIKIAGLILLNESSE
ncbi:MAG: hypothetical protein A2513_01840 [Sulfurimonas sp. RIFOXYD12_FULL_33_39]|uniref:ABC transporter substrate-binding protein n=1 Tax=unclassified Sulfurimonas TaxID=2623549 RepID=UPI0008D6A092|nr:MULTISPECIES: ABC transporter substrate binding protein [unclassified Sulfurimonas]OHE08736.1 MAG: hypothetical protein A2513_01840 [Sulfurimonas sp. RIFOXYD12_FULL_33_39]OHE14021.1 MAG: hypothetical protein A2530_03165 [Sulfurimonas sp. RIFOXYD2_FULL_34_21]